MREININWKDIKADMYAYMYGSKEKLEAKLLRKIGESLERQMALLIQIENEKGVLAKIELGPDLSHDGPTLDLSPADYRSTEYRLLQHARSCDA